MKVTFSSWPQGRSLSTPPCSHRSTSTSRIIIEAGVASGHDLLGLDPQQLGEHLAQLPDALEPAVVAGVDPGSVLDALGQAQQVVGQVELGRRGLAAGEVEGQAARLERGIRLLLLLGEGLELLGGALGEGGGAVAVCSVTSAMLPEPRYAV